MAVENRREKFIGFIAGIIMPLAITFGNTLINDIHAKEIEKQEKQEEYSVRLKLKPGDEDGVLIYEAEEEIPNSWFQIQGQIVVVDKDGEMIKTFHVPDMFEKASVPIKDNSYFEIKRIPCPLADRLEEQLEEFLAEELQTEGIDKEQITTKRIGFVTISVNTREMDAWLKYYFILEGDALTKISDEVVELKKEGVWVSDEWFENEYERKKVLEETKQAVVSVLKKPKS